MQELNFDIEACLERWPEWYHVVCDGDSDSCCQTYELNDPLLIKIIKCGYIEVELALPLSDYSGFNDRTDTAKIHYSDADEQGDTE